MVIALVSLAVVATAGFLAFRFRPPRERELSEYHDSLDALGRIDESGRRQPNRR